MVEIAGLIEYAGYNAPVIFINGGQVACVFATQKELIAQAEGSKGEGSKGQRNESDA